MKIELINQEDIRDILDTLNLIKSELSVVKQQISPQFKVYTNADLRELLGVQDKLIRKYRDEGKLPFHKEGDKYWYTQADIDTFLKGNYYEPYNIA